MIREMDYNFIFLPSPLHLEFKNLSTVPALFAHQCSHWQKMLLDGEIK